MNGINLREWKKATILLPNHFYKSPLPPLYQEGNTYIFLLVKGDGFDVVEDGVFVIFNSRLYNDLASTIYGHIKIFQVELKNSVMCEIIL